MAGLIGPFLFQESSASIAPCCLVRRWWPVLLFATGKAAARNLFRVGGADVGISVSLPSGHLLRKAKVLLRCQARDGGEAVLGDINCTKERPTMLPGVDRSSGLNPLVSEKKPFNFFITFMNYQDV